MVNYNFAPRPSAAMLERRRRFDAAWDGGHDHDNLFFGLARRGELPPTGRTLCSVWLSVTEPEPDPAGAALRGLVRKWGREVTDSVGELRRGQ